MLDDRATEALTRALFGEHAVRAPWFGWVQDQGRGIVTLAGPSRMSRTGSIPNPLRFGSDHAHQFVVGEVILRPHLVIGTDEMRGMGLAGLLTNAPDIADLAATGDVLINQNNTLARLTPGAHR